jgi:hypothetical protein
LPLCSIELVRTERIKFRIGFPECCAKSEIELESILKINSRKGINMPIETIEKIIERTVQKK